MPFVLLGRALVAFELRGKQFKALTIMCWGGVGGIKIIDLYPRFLSFSFLKFSMVLVRLLCSIIVT